MSDKPQISFFTMQDIQEVKNIDEFFSKLHGIMTKILAESGKPAVASAFPYEIVFIIYCNSAGIPPGENLPDEEAQVRAEQVTEAIISEIEAAGLKYDMDIDLDCQRDMMRVSHPSNEMLKAARKTKPTSLWVN